MAACTKGTSSTGLNEDQDKLKNDIEFLNKEIVNYKTQIDVKEKAITELEMVIEEQNNQQKVLSNAIARQGMIISILNEISESYIPEQYKQAYIKEIQEYNSSYTFIVDFASWERRDDAPNGGEVVNEEEEMAEIEVDKNTFFYVIDSAQLSNRSAEEFMSSWDDEDLYQFFFYDDKVLLITQVLLP
ncbi:hypothetical protein [Ornithinibacillus californiensis]|uniref:hypothetical protein n=1 Tax=Ornithinibacillus californiensis TaxID=161536 RepID=UPI00064DEDCB|nr:hypothetical protein [Ornithinibacillus californiensis]